MTYLSEKWPFTHRKTFNGIMLRSGFTLLSGVGSDGIYKARISKCSHVPLLLEIYDINTGKYLDGIIYQTAKHIDEIWEILDRRVLIEKKGFYL